MFTQPSGTLQNFQGLDNELKKRLIQAAGTYNAATGQKLQINSGRRSSGDQWRLWEESVAAGRKGRTAGGHPIAYPGTSPHERGIAVDINNFRDPTARQALAQAGLYARVANDPMHYHMADGGVARGPKSGYPATLHGTEAVVPLPDGKSIPVKVQDSTQIPGLQDLSRQISNAAQSRDISVLADSVSNYQRLIGRSLFNNRDNMQKPLHHLLEMQSRLDPESMLNQITSDMAAMRGSDSMNFARLRDTVLAGDLPRLQDMINQSMDQALSSMQQMPNQSNNNVQTLQTFQQITRDMTQRLENMVQQQIAQEQETKNLMSQLVGLQSRNNSTQERLLRITAS